MKRSAPTINELLSAYRFEKMKKRRPGSPLQTGPAPADVGKEEGSVRPMLLHKGRHYQRPRESLTRSSALPHNFRPLVITLVLLSSVPFCDHLTLSERRR